MEHEGPQVRPPGEESPPRRASPRMATLGRVTLIGAGIGGLSLSSWLPVPVLVAVLATAGALVATLVVVVLTAALSTHAVRQANAAAVLDRLIIASAARRSDHPGLVAASQRLSPAVPPGRAAAGKRRRRAAIRRLEGT